jgi:hypothetical protein
MLKDLTSIGSTMRVTSRNFHIKFFANAGGIMKREVCFGEIEDGDMQNSSDEYSEEFNTACLASITKLAGLSNNMQIYPGNPLLFKSSVGSLGYIEIYVKSKNQIETENLNTLDSEYDSDE